MIQSIKKISRNLSILISFALVVFISACGGSVDDGAEEVAKGGSISLSATSSTVSAGQSSIITATVLDGAGGIARDKTVTFSIISNKSGGTVTALNNGKTDANGQAIATYTAGSANPSSEVEDSIQASVSGATNVIIITRTSSSSTAYRLALTADSTTVTAGTTTIVKATVTDGAGKAVSGQAVTFSLLENKSGATLTTLSLGVTDSSGQALAIYKGGSVSPTLTVQDTIQASVTGATGVIIINRTPGSASASELHIGLGADLTSLTAGDTTIVTATVSSGSAPAVGQTVSFTFLSNNSGATLNVLNGGRTDASGQAIAMYRAGANSPSTIVQDTIQASVTGAVAALIITRTPGGGTAGGMILNLSAESTSVEGGETTILTAKVTDSKGSPVQGEAVVFGFAPGGNQSGAAITVLTGTTDAAGEATALYAAGTLTGATVQDIVQASITGSTKALIITKTGTASGVTPDSIYLSASPTSVKSDGSTTSTISVKALNSLKAEISGVVVTMETDTGVLSAPTVTTPGTVTFTCGADKANPKATITGSSGYKNGHVTVQITGTTVKVTSNASSIAAPPSATSSTLTITVKDAGGNGVSGQVANLKIVPAPKGIVTLGEITEVGNGEYRAEVTGSHEGTVTIEAQYQSKDVPECQPVVGETNLTVTGNTFEIIDPTTDLVAMTLSDTLPVIVNVPAGVSSVTFATTIGEWDGGTTKTVTKSGLIPPTTVSANLTSTNIGIANIHVYSTAAPTTYYDTLTVAMTSGAAPNKIILQASSTVVPVSVGTTTYSSTLTATVYDASNFPLVNKPVAFEIVDGTSTSGGEKISPVIVMTDDTGRASTTFTSGSMPTSGSGVKIRASVVGTTVSTEFSPPSGNDVAIVIGGTAGSIAFGWDSKAEQDHTGANYLYKMSVLVADANGNPIPGAVVSLGVWPIAWSDGMDCVPDKFYLNEDNTVVGKKENMILDPGEDGCRIEFDPYNPGEGYAKPGPVLFGTKDGKLTPVNSAGGTVPASVTTDENGVAGFTLTYPKSSGMWIKDIVRATTIVQGTETRAETLVYLKIVVGEEVICAESPFKY